MCVHSRVRVCIHVCPSAHEGQNQIPQSWNDEYREPTHKDAKNQTPAPEPSIR